MKETEWRPQGWIVDPIDDNVEFNLPPENLGIPKEMINLEKIIQEIVDEIGGNISNDFNKICY